MVNYPQSMANLPEVDVKFPEISPEDVPAAVPKKPRFRLLDHSCPCL